jgi:hypothetical protein
MTPRDATDMKRLWLYRGGVTAMPNRLIPPMRARKIRRWAGLACCCALLSHAALAQDKQVPPTPPTPPQPPFGSEIKKAVAFIQTECRTPKGKETYAGTGFFLIMPDSRLGTDRGFAYLITNRHVVQPGIENSTPCDIDGYSLWLNLKARSDGQVTSQRVPLLGASWYFPTDDSVDLAALPLSPNRDVYDSETVPLSVLADQKADALREGDEVLFAGLFIQYPGQTKMEPIVRSGSIAMLPDETMPTTLKKPGHVYLAEVHSFGGNSGSPMFVDVGGLRRGQIGYSFKLLGVVAGEVFETADFQLRVATTLNGEVTANSGISVVVPASEIKALLETPQIQKLRDEGVAAEKSAHK